VAGEPVVVPPRVYNPEPCPHVVAGMSHVESVVTAAIYSRHHDGLVRQRHLGTLLDADEPWTAPFIVQLLGEYVIDTAATSSGSHGRRSQPGRHCRRACRPSSVRTAASFTTLTRQRAISYWSCYHRGQHPSRDTYPALAALAMLTGRATT
jgi:hypothetical protein